MPPCGVSTLTKTALPSHKGIPVTGQLRIEIVVSYSARMSMLPEIHFNFGQVTFERIYQVFLPLIPGGTLVGGLVLAYPQRVHDAEVTLGLGPYSRVAVLICGIYLVGFILYGFSLMVSGNCAVLLANIVPRYWPPNRPNEGPSKSWVWRRVATEFLGPSLSPSPSTVPGAPQAYGFDVEWRDLYNILQDYMLRGVVVLSNEFFLLFTYLQATGWALFYLYWRTALRGHWSIMVVSIVFILSTAPVYFTANFFYWKYDRLTAWDFTARLINEIKNRQKSSTPASQI